MSDEGDEHDDEFLLYDAGVIERLRDRPFFREAIAQFYVRLAAMYGCDVTLSGRRIGEAHDFWLGDEERTLHSGTDDETTELDHFKHAAFIAFWLRRLVIINDINFRKDERVPAIASADGKTAPSQAQIDFYRYGNEICALAAGFYICLAYETYAMSKRQEKTGNMQVISDAIFVQEMPKHLLTEYPRLLKHKNVSPHGLYMLYRSLFDTLKWEIRGRDTAA